MASVNKLTDIEVLELYQLAYKCQSWLIELIEGFVNSKNGTIDYRGVEERFDSCVERLKLRQEGLPVPNSNDIYESFELSEEDWEILETARKKIAKLQ